MVVHPALLHGPREQGNGQEIARVPFYVVLNEEGRLVDKGNNVDFTQYLEEQDKENMVGGHNNEQEIFVIDDLDF